MALIDIAKKVGTTPQQATNTASPSGDVWTREYLKSKYGLDDSEIGFNNGMVSVGGKNVFKPTSVSSEGKSYANPAFIDAAMMNMPNPNATGATKPGVTTDPNYTMGGSGAVSGFLASQQKPPQQPAAGNAVSPANNTFNPAQSSGYQSPFADKMNALVDKILNAKEFSFNADTDPNFQAMKAKYEKQGQSAFDNQIARLSSMTGGFGNSYATGMASKAQNNYNEDLMALVPGMEQNAYSRYKDGINNDVSSLNTLSGMDTTAYNRFRNTVTDSNTAQDRAVATTDMEHKKFADSIKGLGDQMNYGGAIDKNKADGDPSNDWQIPILQQERQAKMDKMASDYGTNINQYYDNFQQAINDLDPNDPIYAQKKSMLLMQRAAKVEQMRKDKILADAVTEKTRQFDITEEEKKRSNMAQEGISQQNANSTALNAGKKAATATPAETKAIFAKEYSFLKGKSYDDAQQALREGAQDYMEAFGESGYRSLWNSVLSDAIKEGKAKPMQATPTVPKEDPNAELAQMYKDYEAKNGGTK